MATHAASDQHSAWQAGVAKVLGRGRPSDQQPTGEQAEAKLTTRVEGLEVKGLYHDDAAERGHGLPGQMPFVRGRRAQAGAAYWTVCALHDHDGGSLDADVQADLLGGAESVWFRFDPGALDPREATNVLQRVGASHSSSPVRCSSLTAAGEIADAVASRGGSLHAALNAGLDPYASARATGGEVSLEAVMRVIETGDEHITAVALDGTDLHEAGAYASTVLGTLLAQGIDLLRRLGERGISARDAWRHITFRLPVDQDQFLSIAAVRALRWGWATVGESLDIPADQRGAYVHAVTSRRMLSTIDPYNNLLRGCVAAFAAGVGGADEVTVLPFDDRLGVPSRLGRRMARNTQSLLLRESNLGHVIDPAGGSTYVENLTEQLARASWAHMQTIESAGGVCEYIANGSLAELISEQEGQRAADIATRKRPLTGVTEFAPLVDVDAPREPRGEGFERAVLAPQFDSARVEQLRARGVALGEASGTSAQVPVVVLGEYKDYSARLGFVASALAIAGVQARPVPLDEVEGALGGSPVVMVAASPAGYAEHGADAMAAIGGAAPDAWVVGAGRAKEWVSDTTPEHFIGLGVDILEFCEQVVQRLAGGR